jgi:amidase
MNGDTAAVWRVRGEPLAPPTGSGPLDGLTVAVKDLFPVTGFAVGGGNPQWLAEALPSASDAPVVAALRAAGAAVTGIAQTDELAYSLSGANVHYGTPPNPAAPDRVTGGSSNGPASAVALGEADIGLGTDTGGSIRVPASCCGLYGLRPTLGAVDNTDVLPLAPSFDTVGWMTRDAGTLRLVGAVLLPDGPTDLPRRVLLVRGNPDVDAAVEAAASGWGASVETIDWPGDPGAMLAAFKAVQAVEGWRNHGAWIEAHPRTLALDIESRYRFGSTVDADQEAQARAAIAAWRAELLNLLGDDTWLALPAAGGPGHPREVSAEAKDAWRQSTLQCTVPASACGLPSVSIPTGASPPIGMAFIGPPGSDRALLEASFLG